MTGILPWVAFFSAAAAVNGTLLALMTWCPRRWREWVVRENAFWVRRGLATPRLASTLTRLESGRVPVWVAAVAGVICLGAASALLGYAQGRGGLEPAAHPAWPMPGPNVAQTAAVTNP